MITPSLISAVLAANLIAAAIYFIIGVYFTVPYSISCGNNDSQCDMYYIVCFACIITTVWYLLTAFASMKAMQNIKKISYDKIDDSFSSISIAVVVVMLMITCFYDILIIIWSISFNCNTDSSNDISICGFIEYSAGIALIYDLLIIYAIILIVVLIRRERHKTLNFTKRNNALIDETCPLNSANNSPDSVAVLN